MECPRSKSNTNHFNYDFGSGIEIVAIVEARIVSEISATIVERWSF